MAFVARVRGANNLKYIDDTINQGSPENFYGDKHLVFISFL